MLATDTVEDMNTIIERLQKSYPEYRRKKHYVLKNSVQNAIEMIKTEYDISNDSDHDDLQSNEKMELDNNNK